MSSTAGILVVGLSNALSVAEFTGLSTTSESVVEDWLISFPSSTSGISSLSFVTSVPLFSSSFSFSIRSCVSTIVFAGSASSGTPGSSTTSTSCPFKTPSGSTGASSCTSGWCSDDNSPPAFSTCSSSTGSSSCRAVDSGATRPPDSSSGTSSDFTTSCAAPSFNSIGASSETISPWGLESRPLAFSSIFAPSISVSFLSPLAVLEGSSTDKAPSDNSSFVSASADSSALPSSPAGFVTESSSAISAATFDCSSWVSSFMTCSLTLPSLGSPWSVLADSGSAILFAYTVL